MIKAKYFSSSLAAGISTSIALGGGGPPGPTVVPATLGGLEVVYGNVVQVFLSVGGVVLFILLLSAGFKYLTSGGDPKSVEGAKKTLTYAIGGLVLLAGSYLLLRIIKDITGVKAILEFNITH